VLTSEEGPLGFAAFGQVAVQVVRPIPSAAQMVAAVSPLPFIRPANAAWSAVSLAGRPNLRPDFLACSSFRAIAAGQGVGEPQGDLAAHPARTGDLDLYRSLTFVLAVVSSPSVVSRPRKPSLAVDLPTVWAVRHRPPWSTFAGVPRRTNDFQELITLLVQTIGEDRATPRRW
jgi:hypothetical protein